MRWWRLRPARWNGSPGISSIGTAAMWPTTTRPPRQLAHLMDVEVIGRGADIKMDVDIDVELARQLEGAIDLRCTVRVVARRAADQMAPRWSPATSSSSVPG
jgi:hypothetical protein